MNWAHRLRRTELTASKLHGWKNRSNPNPMAAVGKTQSTFVQVATEMREEASCFGFFCRGTDVGISKP